MVTLLNTSNRRGEVLTAAIQFPAAWIGELVTISLTTRGSDRRNASKSFDLAVEAAPDPAGPWRFLGGFHWQSTGSNVVDKFGVTNSPSAVTFPAGEDLRDWWLRVTCQIPETMRIQVDAEIEA